MWGATTAAAKTVRASRRAAGLEQVRLDALRVDLVIDRILGIDTLETSDIEAPSDARVDPEPVDGYPVDSGQDDQGDGGATEVDGVGGFPSCHQPAHACDCDHVVAYRDGRRDGQTVRLNLGPLCRRHHNAKTHGRWRLHYDPTTRTRTWTSPLGLTHLMNATPLLT